MAKRFTDTNKWRDPWFEAMTPQNKLLWLYLTDSCDGIGVIDYSKKRADFETGMDCDINEFIRQSDGRIVRLKNGKLFITKFISFQQGYLSEKCPAHKPLLRLLAENPEVVEIIRNTLSDTLLDTLSNRVQVIGIVKEVVKGGAGGEEKIAQLQQQLIDCGAGDFGIQISNAMLTHHPGQVENGIANFCETGNKQRATWNYIQKFIDSAPQAVQEKKDPYDDGTPDF